MAKKKVEEVIVKIKKSIESKKTVIGTKAVMKALRENELAEVFFSSNIPASREQEITEMAKINKVKITKLKQANDELGIIYKKPFFISASGIKK